MYQTFEVSGGPAGGKARTKLLRAELNRRGLDGLLVPHSDEYQSEYLPPAAERLAWLTGFTGSAGFAVLLAEEAYLFVDGRYTIQARNQSDPDVFTAKSLVSEPPSKWLEKNLNPGSKIGYDPRMHAIEGARVLRTACKKAGGELVALESNPLDAVWSDQPAAPVGPIAIQKIEFAGETAASKLTRIDNALADKKCDALILTLSDSIAWTFNIRGSDITNNPVPLCYAIIRRGQKPFLLVDPGKINAAVRGYLEEICDLANPDELQTMLTNLAGEDISIHIDPNSAADWFAQILGNGKAKIKHGADPVIAMKAIKNEAEISGTRAAHLRDGVAMCRFLAWLDRTVDGGNLDEILAATKLEEIRASSNKLKDISFDSISASGPSGAMCHYRVSEQSNLPIEQNSLFLIDSGGQYEDGTTDITRTVAIGKPTDEMRQRFTLVLKGHIAIATARVPKGTSGAQIDSFARRFLWDAGLDFDHGTGHGVGSYLSVHEGPQNISKRGSVALEPGMIVSNEPGYYKEGEYGIRIENLVLVQADERGPDGLETMSFETLSFTPIDLALVDIDLMSDTEIEWLNAYHAETCDKHAAQLDNNDRQWLEQATHAISR